MTKEKGQLVTALANCKINIWESRKGPKYIYIIPLHVTLDEGKWALPILYHNSISPSLCTALKLMHVRQGSGDGEDNLQALASS